MWLRVTAAAAVVASGVAVYVMQEGEEATAETAQAAQPATTVRAKPAAPRAYHPPARSPPLPAPPTERSPERDPELAPDQPRSMAEEAEAELAMWRQYQSNFAEETRDASWAQAAERDVLEGLAQIVQPFEGSVATVECRSSRCQANLRWPDGVDVQELSMFALHRSHKAMNCARHMRVDDADNTTIIFEC